jgi:hypothetical protein
MGRFVRSTVRLALPLFGDSKQQRWTCRREKMWDDNGRTKKKWLKKEEEEILKVNFVSHQFQNLCVASL